MLIIVGLGNPGNEYINTRHNTGRQFVDWFKSQNTLPEWHFDKKTNALVSEGKFGKGKITLVLPETFMNKSGNAVSGFIKSKRAAESLIVIHDELDLPIGRVKMSFNRSSGGHKGVESIKRAIKTEAFVRIRIGISNSSPSGKLKKPSGDNEVNKYILGKFKPNDLTQLKKISKKINEALMLFVNQGMEKATGFCNSQ